MTCPLIISLEKRKIGSSNLAVLIREVANRGDAERVLCKDILESFVNYTKNDLDSKFSRL